MANTTSGTTTFDKTFAIDEIVEEAHERIGLQNVAGYQLKSARRSLNVLFQEWGNRGIHYWEIGSTNINFLDHLMMVQVRPQLHRQVFMECQMY
jgi:hypothetical protein